MPEFLSLGEIARRIGIARNTAAKVVENNPDAVRHIRLPNHTRYSYEDVVAVLTR